MNFWHVVGIATVSSSLEAAAALPMSCVCLWTVCSAILDFTIFLLPAQLVVAQLIRHGRLFILQGHALGELPKDINAMSCSRHWDNPTNALMLSSEQKGRVFSIIRVYEVASLVNVTDSHTPLPCHHVIGMDHCRCGVVVFVVFVFSIESLYRSHYDG